MKAYHLRSPGSLDGLVCRDEPTRAIEAHEVRIRMRAASINYRDLLIVLDQVPGGGTIPDVIPFSDGAGDVLEVGSAVIGIAPGDRVVAVFNPAWIDGPPVAEYLTGSLGGARHGTLTQEAILTGDGVLKFPEHLSYEEAAAHGCASVTAWSSLIGGRPLVAGQTVLVQGTGGVAIFALQYAKAMGAQVIATTSSAEKAALLRSLGADATIDYRDRSDWEGDVRDLTGGLGVDRVVEVGGPGTMRRSVAATAAGGHVAIVGFAGGPEGGLSPLALIGNGVTLEGIAVGSRRNFIDSLRVTAQSRLRPVIDKVFAFGEARAAYEHLMARRHKGKIVIAID